ncbi:MAG: methyltransferase domain-containing protein [Desulfobacterales bacterium]|nr:methyltransferase domain-containing protein [Desulfobacterales bacterium]
MGEWDAGRILGVSGQYWHTCAIHAGVKLDLFTIIGEHGLTGKAAAEKIGGDERGVDMLLNALVALGLLVKKDDVFYNSRAAADFLSKDAPGFLGHIMMHHHHLMSQWSRLDEGVVTGGPVASRIDFSDEQKRESFLMGMFNMAMRQAPLVISHLDLSGRRRLLDLGGGPGTYSIHFCQNNPGLRATVFDLPTTRPFAEKTIRKFNLSDRIDFQEGDFLNDEVRGKFDAAWISHILHGEGPEGCARIIAKAVAALEPGGLIIIQDFILDNTMDGPLFPALFSLNMLLGTDGGQSYSEARISEMLSENGVRDIRRLPYKGPTDSAIMTGVV